MNKREFLGTCTAIAATAALPAAAMLPPQRLYIIGPDEDVWSRTRRLMDEVWTDKMLLWPVRTSSQVAPGQWTVMCFYCTFHTGLAGNKNLLTGNYAVDIREVLKLSDGEVKELMEARLRCMFTDMAEWMRIHVYGKEVS